MPRSIEEYASASLQPRDPLEERIQLPRGWRRSLHPRDVQLRCASHNRTWLVVSTDLLRRRRALFVVGNGPSAVRAEEFGVDAPDHTVVRFNDYRRAPGTGARVDVHVVNVHAAYNIDAAPLVLHLECYHLEDWAHRRRVAASAAEQSRTHCYPAYRGQWLDCCRGRHTRGFLFLRHFALPNATTVVGFGGRGHYYAPKKKLADGEAQPAKEHVMLRELGFTIL